MNENPFKIIGIEEEPPADLRKEVLGSVHLAVLAMRVTQLFLADYANAIFDNLKVRRDPSNDPTDTDRK
ncbi:MAG: hypothetical protein KF905_08890 [Flavobacteriales bacterium]|nr:hypothetical protein [Flavobacteriales bacterium]